MALYPIHVPERNSIDALAEARERRDQRTRARMDQSAFVDAILAQVRSAIEDHDNPLSELMDQLWDAPIRDRFDYRAFLEMRDGTRPGRALLAAVAEASLSIYQDADIEGF